MVRQSTAGACKAWANPQIKAGYLFVPFILIGFVWMFSAKPALWSLAVYALLWPMAFIDWHSHRLPNLLTALFFMAGALYVMAARTEVVGDHLIGAGAGLAVLPTINLLYRGLRGRDGIGLGDAKLLAGAGVWLGWQALPFVLLLASVFGLAFAGILMIVGKPVDGSTRVAFGPFLCLAIWLAWLDPLQIFLF